MGSTTIPADLDERIRRREMARQKANRVRMARAVLLRRMKALPHAESCAMAADIVNDTPEVLGSMSTLSFMESVRKIGRHTAPRFLNACRVPLDVQLRELTSVQRSALEATLRYRSDMSVWKTGVR